MKKTMLWKSMEAGLKSANGNVAWKIGEWQKHDRPLEMCKSGFHASEKVIDSMQYVNMENLAHVEVQGKHLTQPDKQCWAEMRIAKAWRWEKKDSVGLAIFAAELVIDIYEKQYPKDDRPRKAIEAAKAWLKNPTEKNRAAARSAARSAAGSARLAAWSAAWSAVCSAARSAAGSAVWSAASSAAWSPSSAAWSAAWLAARSAASSAAWSPSSAARSAASSAAWSPSSAARLAASSAAWSPSSAARLAAWSAAWSAASSAASSAALHQILDTCEKWIQQRIKTLEEIKA